MCNRTIEVSGGPSRRRARGYWSRTLGLVGVLGSGAALAAYQQPQTTDGLVSMEAEHLNSQKADGQTYIWAPTAGASYAGGQALQAFPEDSIRYEYTSLGNSARADYQIRFVQAGTYHVWVRALGPNGSSDSVHVGLNGTVVASGASLSDYQPWGSLKWATLQNGTTTRITVQVPSAGLHTVNLWMRESGTIVDKIVLTRNSAWVPSGNGPEETAQESSPPAALQAFAPDGILQARIRWTDYGVPHISGDSLEETGFGSGYAFARDHVCLLADQIIRYNSKRSRYFGPDREATDDALNVISDFSYLALGIRQQAESQLPRLGANARALLSGYARGYNLYLEETGLDRIDAQCARQDWVKPLSDVDLLTLSLGLALLPGAENFLAPIFRAAPPGKPYEPTLARSREHSVLHEVANTDTPTNPSGTTRFRSHAARFALPDLSSQNLASNGWALGTLRTANGKGMVLANPHFPHTGNLRFWESHITIPGHLNVAGASIAGMPGVVNIGFNEAVAWTHTFSTAEHFVVYQLELDERDSTGMTYLFDGKPEKITARELSIEVLAGSDAAVTITKRVYTSRIGPMLVVPGELDWTTQEAYAIRDANQANFDIVDHWLAMNRARNLSEFKQAFQNFDGLVFNNTMAADKMGNAFYIDDSNVPDVPAAGIQALQYDATTKALRSYAGFTILPASSGTLFTDTVPFDRAPKLDRTDFVQNSNDSYWLTNPSSKLTGKSPLYGPVGNEQSLRSRLAQQFLQKTDPVSGGDGKFSLTELEATLLNNRTYLGDSILTALKSRCAAHGAVAVSGVSGISGTEVKAGCDALARWNGRMDAASVGALVFREFAEQFALLPNSDKWAKAFSSAYPLSTPNTLSTKSTIMQAFARGLRSIKAAGFSVTAPLGTVQFVERSTVTGAPSGTRWPWAGANDVEGGFNVFVAEEEHDGTLLPRHVYPSLNGTQLSKKGYHVTYGSSWMYVLAFTDTGPQARGLLTYSQSDDRQSPHYLDQTAYYSQAPRLRPIRFTEADIAANLREEKNLQKRVR